MLPMKVLTALRVVVPAPVMVRPPTPLMTPLRDVFLGPAIVSVYPALVMTPELAMSPEAAVKVWAAPRVMGTEMVCAEVELFTMPDAALVMAPPLSV